MAAVMSSSPPSPRLNSSADDDTTDAPSTAGGTVKRPRRSLSCSKDRLSMSSNASHMSQNRSRSGSLVLPIFQSSLPYALVRDFAYPDIDPLHYGPPPTPSTVSSPVSEQRRLSDPPTTWDTWDTSRTNWSSEPWSSNDNGNFGNQQLPAMSFGDGPPYSEDEDLHSPVVMTRHRKYKSAGTDLNGRRGRSQGGADQGSGYFSGDADRGTFVTMNADGSETYYVNDEESAEDGPGGEYVTYPAEEGRYSRAMFGAYDGDQDHNPDTGFDSDDDDWGRYSRDYQFAVGCPDEEMHGRAVALFDFMREHENELPLTEGQVIYVSYRQSQGWLVAEDPKTGESGLVPEEFVRLLRDIEGGLNSLNEGELETDPIEPEAEGAQGAKNLSAEATSFDQTAARTESSTDPSSALGSSDTHTSAFSAPNAPPHPEPTTEQADDNRESNGNHPVKVSATGDSGNESQTSITTKS